MNHFQNRPEDNDYPEKARLALIYCFSLTAFMAFAGFLTLLFMQVDRGQHIDPFFVGSPIIGFVVLWLAMEVFLGIIGAFAGDSDNDARQD